MRETIVLVMSLVGLAAVVFGSEIVIGGTPARSVLTDAAFWLMIAGTGALLALMRYLERRRSRSGETEDDRTAWALFWALAIPALPIPLVIGLILLLDASPVSRTIGLLCLAAGVLAFAGAVVLLARRRRGSQTL